MRTLDKNKTSLWYVELIGTVDNIDSDGFFTGEKIKSYSEPVHIKLNIYPAKGSIVEQIFGKDKSYDMLAVSNEVVLSENMLLFLTKPAGDYDAVYDFKVRDIKKSINTYNYGLRSRT